MGMSAIQCPACGGSVVAAAGEELASCLFCGNQVELVAVELGDEVEPPEGALPFVTTADEARTSFQTFARSSFWYPGDLRDASLELRRLLLPAWAFSGDIETHWTGLVRAPGTANGKRPVGGSERTHLDQVLIPASQALTLAELGKLGAYDEAALAPFSPAEAEDPFEVGEMTRSAGREAAGGEMLRRHVDAIMKAQGLVKIHGSHLVLALSGRPVLVPVYIGAYRYGDRIYRVLVNGQTGTFIGDAPTSWYKVAAVVLGVLAVLGFLAMALSCCGGGAIVAGS